MLGGGVGLNQRVISTNTAAYWSRHTCMIGDFTDLAFFHDKLLDVLQPNEYIISVCIKQHDIVVPPVTGTCVVSVKSDSITYLSDQSLTDAPSDTVFFSQKSSLIVPESGFDPIPIYARITVTDDLLDAWNPNSRFTVFLQRGILE